MEKTLSWEIDDFSSRKNAIQSDIFSSGGCQWYVTAFPKGKHCSDHLSLYLSVLNPNSLRRGWKTRAIFCFVLSNQSGKVLYKSPSICYLFCAEVSNWGYQNTLPLTELERFMEQNKLIVEVYLKVVDFVHQGKSTENDIIDFNGFQILASQGTLLSAMLLKDPYSEVDFEPENQWVKTKYMCLLGLAETLSKSPQSLSASELSNAQKDLSALTEAGLKLDWLNARFEEVSLEWKKAEHSDGSSGVQQLEDRVKNVELSLSDQIIELDKVKIKSAAAAKVSSFQFIDFLIKRFFFSCFSFSKS